MKEGQDMRKTDSLMAIIAIAGVLVGGSLSGAQVALGANPGDPTSSEGQVAAPPPEKSLAERSFHIEWSARPLRPGLSSITGYVYNDYGKPAELVDLQVTTLDAAGRPVAAKVYRIGDTVPSRGRSYFELQVPASDAYHVDVIGYDFVEGHQNN
jgi:hypothetical protein